MTILSPFQKIQFEDYSLATETGYEKLVQRVFGKLKVENANTAIEIPFPIMSSTESNVWEAYCPNRRELKDAGIALHSEALKLAEVYGPQFKKLEVWYESGDQIDPILVGFRFRNKEDEEKGYSWNLQKYLLCRWGEALKPFNDIKQVVFEAHIRREKVRLQRELNNLEFDAMQHFGI